MELRPYQKEALQAIKSSGKTCLIVLAQGAGKTFLIASIMDLLKEGKSCMVVCNRKELLEQGMEKAKEIGLKYETYGASLVGLRRFGRLTFAQIQTLQRCKSLPKVDCVIIDECHHVSANEETLYRNTIEMMRPKKIIGLTATPYRTGEGLTCGEDRLFEKIDYELSNKQLLDAGFACPVNIVPPIDYQYIESKQWLVEGTDINIDPQVVLLRKDIKKLSKFMEDNAGQCNLIFMPSKDVCLEYYNELSEQGDNDDVCMITDETPAKVREKYIALIKRGEMRMILNVGVLGEGFDAPCLDTVFFFRATKSLVFWQQGIGRLSRKFNGFNVTDVRYEKNAADYNFDLEPKKEGRVFDFFCNAERLGDYYHPNLDYEKIKNITCPDCRHTFLGLVKEEVFVEGVRCWKNECPRCKAEIIRAINSKELKAKRLQKEKDYIFQIVKNDNVIIADTVYVQETRNGNPIMIISSVSGKEVKVFPHKDYPVRIGQYLKTEADFRFNNGMPRLLLCGKDKKDFDFIDWHMSNLITDRAEKLHGGLKI